MQENEKLKEQIHHGDLMFPVSLTETMITTNFETPLCSHYHAEVELLQIMDGRAVFQINGEDILLEPGDLVLIKPNVVHGCDNCFKDYLRFRAIVFESAFLMSSTGDIISQNYLQTLLSSRIESFILVKPYTIYSDQLQLDCERIFNHMKGQGEGYEMLIKSLLYELLYYIYHLRRPEDEYTPDMRRTMIVRSIHEHVNRHYQEKLLLADMTKKFSFSEGYFCRFFKENFHMTFGEYLQEVRLSKAEKLVRDTDMSIEQIAMETGFSDANYFTICFKKHLHQTPTQYRKNRKVRQIREKIQ